jgi:hypothetical protein
VFEDRNDTLERVIRHVRRPVRIDSALDGRVMERIATREARRPLVLVAAWHWLVRPRRVAVSPLGGLAAAAVVAIVLVSLPRFGGAPPSRHAPPAAAALREFQFVLVAPGAHRVSLVGDFNDWDPAGTPLHQASARAIWSGVVALGPGRHRYAFLVDGTRWVADPDAPPAPSDEFGTPSSVVTVGGS